MDITIQEIPVTAEIMLLGHTFSGLAEVERAVEVSARIRTGALGYRDINRRVPDRPIPDVHVACCTSHIPASTPTTTQARHAATATIFCLPARSPTPISNA